jgi:uncharacterized protein YecA (UPF0149 family)
MKRGKQKMQATPIPFEIEYPEEAQTLMTICKERGKRKYGNGKRLKPMFLGAEPIKAGTKIGRNDPCPCGSEKKFKKCCG